MIFKTKRKIEENKILVRKAVNNTHSQKAENQPKYTAYILSMSVLYVVNSRLNSEIKSTSINLFGNCINLIGIKTIFNKNNLPKKTTERLSGLGRKITYR